MATTEYPPAAYDAGLPPELRPTYTKLRNGDWGIRVPMGARTGDPVAVYKRDGSSTVLTVGLVLWTGNDKSTGMLVSVATIAGRGSYVRPAAPPKPAPASRPAPARTASRKAPSNRRPTRIPVIAPESAQEPADTKPAQRATVEADKARADAEAVLKLDEPLF